MAKYTKEEIADYVERQGTSFKVGDTVQIYRKVEEAKGWVNSWISDMDHYIGTTGTIICIRDNGIVIDKGCGYAYAYQSLRLIVE